MANKTEYHMVQKHKTYAQYLAESKPITNHLAPVGALPKHTKGDSHRYRIKIKAMKRRGEVNRDYLPKSRDGLINVTKLKKLYKGENV